MGAEIIYGPKMDRNDKILLCAFALALAAIVLASFGPPYRFLFGQTMAAWVQAVGVFAAVYLTGRMTRKHADEQEKARVKRQIASTTAVITKALWAIDNIESGLMLKKVGMMARDPQATLLIVYEALTPLRIHELPNYALVTLALEIKSDIYEIMNWLDANQTGLELQNDRLKLPLHLVDKVARAKRGCELFVRFSNRWYGN